MLFTRRAPRDILILYIIMICCFHIITYAIIRSPLHRLFASRHTHSAFCRAAPCLILLWYDRYDIILLLRYCRHAMFFSREDVIKMIYIYDMLMLRCFSWYISCHYARDMRCRYFPLYFSSMPPPRDIYIRFSSPRLFTYDDAASAPPPPAPLFLYTTILLMSAKRYYFYYFLSPAAILLLCLLFSFSGLLFMSIWYICHAIYGGATMILWYMIWCRYFSLRCWYYILWGDILKILLWYWYITIRHHYAAAFRYAFYDMRRYKDIYDIYDICQARAGAILWYMPRHIYIWYYYYALWYYFYDMSRPAHIIFTPIFLLCWWWYYYYDMRYTLLYTPLFAAIYDMICRSPLIRRFIYILLHTLLAADTLFSSSSAMLLYILFLLFIH